MTSGHVNSGTAPNSSPYYFDKVWDGTNGKFKTVSGRQVIKDNPYTCTIMEMRRTPSIPSGRFINSRSFPLPSSVWTNSHEVSLQSKLVSEVRGHSFNLAVNVAQGKQTVNMVVDNLMKIGRSLRYLRHGDVSSAARQLGASTAGRAPLKSKDVSGRWLELQYGWLPMLSDCYEAMEAYHLLTANARVEKIKVRKSVTVIADSSESPSNWSGFGPCKYRKKITHILRENLSAKRSLGLENPLSVVWEVVPYSFVIDWFLPIGSYLDNLSIIPKLNGEFVTTSSYLCESVSIPYFDVPANPFYYKARSLTRRINVDRVITSGLPVAFPSFVPFPRAMSAKRVYNAIALASQVAFGRREANVRSESILIRKSLGSFVT